MATYAIGDVQGCFSSLNKLLDLIQFDEKKDILWFTGDLVNRGPESLEVLRFVKSLGNKHHTVLGNHDLHLLAVADGGERGRSDDTLKSILSAPDCDELMNWLCHQPLLHHENNFVLVHAGIAAQWDLVSAKKYANEVESILKTPQRKTFFQNMYGDHPDHWQNDLTSWDRLRCIVNYFTRMRFCYPDGRLALALTEDISPNTSDYVPWYQMPNRQTKSLNIIFGHWAALGGVTNTPNVFALDTGCVWGFNLTAMRLEDLKRFSVPC